MYLHSNKSNIYSVIANISVVVNTKYNFINNGLLRALASFTSNDEFFFNNFLIKPLDKNFKIL